MGMFISVGSKGDISLNPEPIQCSLSCANDYLCGDAEEGEAEDECGGCSVSGWGGFYSGI